MTATKEIAEMEITLDDKIQDDAIAQVSAKITYLKNRQRKETSVKSLYCTAEHEYSIGGILKKANLRRFKKITHDIIKIEITHLKTIGWRATTECSRTSNSKN